MKRLLNLIPLLLLASCSEELVETENSISTPSTEKVMLLCHPFEWDGETRTSLTATDSRIVFSWADGDAIGVFPVAPKANSQAKQVLWVAPGTDAHFASFDGAGWDLKDGNTYASYSPYNGNLTSETSYKAVPIDMTGQDGTLETIGKRYDYMYALSTDKIEKTTEGTRHIIFDFEHVVSILQLKLTMPVAAEWKRVSLYCSTSYCFISSATMNVSTGKISNPIKTTSFDIDLENVRTSVVDETVTLYVALLPTTIDDLTVVAETMDGKQFVGKFDSKKLVAGKAYRLSAKLGDADVYSTDGYENGYAYVDLGLPSGLKWATMNVGAKTPYDNGKYYAWGETKAYGEEDVTNLNNYNYRSQSSYVKYEYFWKTYKLCDGSPNCLMKYNLDERVGMVDNKTTLDVEDDAATQNWGGRWRMPTAAEFNELVNNCYLVYTDGYNNTTKKGFIVYKAINAQDKGKIIFKGDTPLSHYSLNIPHIFFPLAAHSPGYDFGRKWSECDIWTSSLCDENVISMDAFCFGLESELSEIEIIETIGIDGTVTECERPMGNSVRAVCE